MTDEPTIGYKSILTSYDDPEAAKAMARRLISTDLRKQNLMLSGEVDFYQIEGVGKMRTIKCLFPVIPYKQLGLGPE